MGRLMMETTLTTATQTQERASSTSKYCTSKGRRHWAFLFEEAVTLAGVREPQAELIHLTKW